MTRSAPAPEVRAARRRRLIGALIAAIGLTALLLAGFGWWLLGTAPGARWGFERLGAYLPGELTVGRVEGPLRGPLLVRDLRYVSDRIQVSMDRLELHWSLRALLAERLDIRLLEADSVRITIVATRPPPAARDTVGPGMPDLDLPLDVLVGRGRITGLFITPAGSDSALRIDEVRLARAAFRDTLDIGELSVRAPNGELLLMGRARTVGRYGFDLESRWTLRPAGREPIAGGGRVLGTLDTLRVLQKIDEPFQVALDVSLFTPLRDLDFAGRLDFFGVDPLALGLELPDGRLSGRVEASGDFDRFTARGELDARTADFGRLRGAFGLERRDSLIEVERLTLAVPGRPAQVVARGTVITAVRGPRFDLRGWWRQLEWPPAAPGEVVSPRGEFRVAGSVERYRVTARGTLAHPALPEFPWSAAGSGTPTTLTVPALAAEPLGGRVSGSARIGWSGVPEWSAQLGARGLDPSRVAGGVEGRLAFDLAARGRGGNVPRTELEVQNLGGTLAERAVAGGGAVTVLPDGWIVSGAEVTWGGNRVTAAGTLRDAWDFRFAVEAPDLTAVRRGAEGRIHGGGRLEGRGAERRIVARLEADSLRFDAVAIDAIVAETDLRPGDPDASVATVTLTALRLPDRVVSHAALTARGWLERHRITLGATSRDDSLRLALAGGWRGPSFTGTLERLDLVSASFGTWGLEQEAALAADRSTLALQGLAWRSGGTRWRADARADSAGRWTVATRLDDLPLARLAPWLPPGLGAEGPLDLVVEAAGTRGRWTGDVALRAGPGLLSWGPAGTTRGSTPLDSATLRIRSTGTALHAALAAGLGTTGHLEARVETPAVTAAGVPGDGPLGGAATVRLRDLSFLEGLVPDLAATAGTATGDLELAGTAARPRWLGRIEVRGQSDVPRLGIGLREVAFDATSSRDGRLAFRGGARSGPGRLDVVGTLDLSRDGGLVADTRLEGDRFLAMDTREARVVVSPRVRVGLRGDSLGVSGEIGVPSADLRERESSRTAVGVSPDVVYVRTGDTTATAPERALAVHADVRLVLGDDVHVEAYGLDAEVEGSVLAIERPHLPTAASGELRLTGGTYQAYGQDLTIERGRLVFAGGPIANPGLDVRATRRARDGVVAGFEVRGTLEQPRFAVFSEPAMAQRDALAYVLFGKRLDRGSGNQQDIVTDAANVLGVGGGSYIAESLARQFGIDDASLESDGSFEEASLMLGTYLSPRLYVNYGIGLLDAVSTLRLQYFLTERWTLQAETGDENRAQVLYTIERK